MDNYPLRRIAPNPNPNPNQNPNPIRGTIFPEAMYGHPIKFNLCDVIYLCVWINVKSVGCEKQTILKLLYLYLLLDSRFVVDLLKNIFSKRFWAKIILTVNCKNVKKWKTGNASLKHQQSKTIFRINQWGMVYILCSNL